jgi:hypothetical protein
MEKILSINEFLDQRSDLNLFYGNPQLSQKEAIEKGSSITERMKSTPIWNKWINTPPPSQDSLIPILMQMSTIRSEEPQFLQEVELDLYGILARECTSLGIETTIEELEKIAENLDPITFELKYHYNYPRPYQTAYALKVPLYPIQSTNASSPAYPSGHAIDSYVICGLMARRKPEVTETLMKLARRLTEARIISGIHYPFDAEFGKQIAEDILSII